MIYIIVYYVAHLIGFHGIENASMVRL